MQEWTRRIECRPSPAVTERPPEPIVSSDRLFLAVPVGPLALAATKGCMPKHSATRRPCRGDRLDQRGAARNAIGPDMRVPQTFFAAVSPIRRVTVVRGPPESSDPSCSIEELRRLYCSKLNTAPSHDGSCIRAVNRSFIEHLGTAI